MKLHLLMILNFYTTSSTRANILDSSTSDDSYNEVINSGSARTIFSSWFNLVHASTQCDETVSIISDTLHLTDHDGYNSKKSLQIALEYVDTNKSIAELAQSYRLSKSACYFSILVIKRKLDKCPDNSIQSIRDLKSSLSIRLNQREFDIMRSK